MALDNRARDLERWLEEQRQRLNAWEAKLNRREAELESVRSPGYSQYPQPSQQYQQGFSPQGGQYYPPPQSYPPPPGQRREYAYTQPQPAQPSYEYGEKKLLLIKLVSSKISIAPQIPPSVAAVPLQSPPVQLPPAIIPIATTQPPPAIVPIATAQPPPVAIVAQQKVSLDLELATMLQRDLSMGAKAQIDEDAEMARLLQEEEDREHRMKVEMDTQLALMMQVRSSVVSNKGH